MLFVDLGMIHDPSLVSTAVTSMLGLSVQSDDATPNLVAYLRNKRILLILDTCEHLVEAVAPLAESIIDAASQVHILATSREALRVESEHIYRLDAAMPTSASTGTWPRVRSTSSSSARTATCVAAGRARRPITSWVGFAPPWAKGAAVTAKVEKILDETAAVKMAIRRAAPGDLVVCCVDDAVGVYRLANELLGVPGSGSAISDPGEFDAPSG